MSKETLQFDREACDLEMIAAYIEGDLDLETELYLERHTLDCAQCSEELNRQKRLMSVLESYENDDQIVLPPNFAKIVAARAENNVAGLREQNERKTALKIVLGLVMACVILFLVSTETMVGQFSLFEKIGTVFSFVFLFFYNLLHGAIVILKVLSVDLLSAPQISAGLMITLLTVVGSLSLIVLFRQRRFDG